MINIDQNKNQRLLQLYHEINKSLKGKKLRELSMNSKEIDIDKLMIAVAFKQSNMDELCINQLYGSILEEQNVDYESLSLTISCLQLIYQQTLKKKCFKSLSIWVLLHLSCLCKKMMQKKIGAMRFLQWNQAIESLKLSNQNISVDKEELFGDYIKIRNFLLKVPKYELDYEKYLQNQRCFKSAQLNNLSEIQKIDIVKYRLIIISALNKPHNTYLLFGKLKNLSKTWIQYLSKLQNNTKFSYRVNKPEYLIQYLRHQKVDSSIKYFQIIKDSIGPIRASLFHLEYESALKKLEFLPKRQKLDIITGSKKMIKWGEEYRRKILNNPDEFVLKADKRQVKKQLQITCVRILYIGQFNTSEYFNIFQAQLKKNSLEFEYKSQPVSCISSTYLQIYSYKDLQKLKKQIKLSDIVLLPRYIKLTEDLKKQNYYCYYLQQQDSSFQQIAQNIVKYVANSPEKLQTNFSIITVDSVRFRKMHQVIKWMIRTQNQSKAAEDFQNFFKDFYINDKFFGQNNEDSLKSQFPQNFKQIIQQYSKQNYFHKFLNLGLRKLSDPLHLAYFIYPVSHLFWAIKCLFHAQAHGKQRKKEIVCYRGCFLNNFESQMFMKNEGEFIEMSGFLSTSIEKQKAYDFAKRGNCLLTIYIPKIKEDQYGCFGFANIKNFSSHPQENQILFNPLNIFKIQSFKETKQEIRYKIKLVYTSIDQIYQRYRINRIQKRNGKSKQIDEDVWRIFGMFLNNDEHKVRNQGDLIKDYLWWHLHMLTDKYEKKKHIIMKKSAYLKNLKILLPQKLLKIFTYSPQQQIYNKMSRITIQQFLYLVDLCSHECSYLMINLIDNYQSYGIECYRESIQMLEDYVEYLESKMLVEKTMKRNFFIEAGFVYINLATIYKQIREYQKCQEAVKQTLFYCEGAYPNQKNFQTFQCYSILCDIYIKQQKYSLALWYCQFALEQINQERGVVNEFFGSFWNKKGEIFLNLGQKDKAIDNYIKALQYIKVIMGKNNEYKRTLIKICELLSQTKQIQRIKPYFQEILNQLFKWSQESFNIQMTKYNWWVQMGQNFLQLGEYQYIKICVQIAHLLHKNYEGDSLLSQLKKKLKAVYQQYDQSEKFNLKNLKRVLFKLNQEKDDFQEKNDFKQKLSQQIDLIGRQNKF